MTEPSLEELVGERDEETLLSSVIRFSWGMLKGFSPSLEKSKQFRTLSELKNCWGCVIPAKSRGEKLYWREAVRDFWKCFWTRKERQIWDAFKTAFWVPALGWVQWPDYKMRWVILPALGKKDYLGLFPAVLQNPHVTPDESLQFNFLLFTCQQKSESRADNFPHSLPSQMLNAAGQNCSSFMWSAKHQVSKVPASTGASCS